MLTPDYYFNCTDDIIEVYSKLDQSITRDIARRILKAGYVTEGAKWQIQVEREAGLLYDDIISSIAEYTETSESAVKALFEDAGITSKDFDDKIYKESGKTPIPLKSSQAMLQVLQAGIEKTNGLLSNLTKTTALTAQTAFIDACTLAEMEITSGAFDYNTAIRHAVESAISQGCYVEYASGARATLEAAVRRAVMTGVSQTTGEISLANAKEMDTDLMEITAHGGARPSHAVWQGQIVCISGKRSGYLTLSDIGYGEVTGFKGVNCRHDWYPFLEGVSTLAHTKKELEDLKNATVIYNGEEIPLYEAQQKQRAMERIIREERRKALGYEEAAKTATNKKLKEDLETNYYTCAQKIKQKEKIYDGFCNETGLTPQKDRLYKYGYNKSESQKVLVSNRNAQQYNKLVGVKTKTGISISEVGTHIKSRALARQTTVEDIQDALTNPLQLGKIRTDKSQHFVGEKVTAVINTETGKLITTWPTSASRAKKLLKKSEQK
jgi:hypothetical protein